MANMLFSISVQKGDEQDRWKNCKEFNDIQRSKRKQLISLWEYSHSLSFMPYVYRIEHRLNRNDNFFHLTNYKTSLKD